MTPLQKKNLKVATLLFAMVVVAGLAVYRATQIPFEKTLGSILLCYIVFRVLGLIRKPKV